MFFISPFCRFFLCFIPYLILISNKDIIYHITGPITIPPFNEEKGSIIYWIGAIEFIRIFYEPILRIILSFNQKYYRSSSILRKMCTKYAIILIMKLFIIFYQSHRLKYYLHVFFLELFLILINVLADIVENYKVSLAMDIVLVDSLNRVTIFYELTRTFNPNFGLYFFGNNLLSLICYQLQGNKKLVLYTKHDIYRIMIVTMGYLCLFSLLQCSITYRPLVIFTLTAYFFYEAIREFSHQPITELKKVEEKRSENFDQMILNCFRIQKRLNNSMPVKQSIREEFWKIVKNKPFLYFVALVLVTITIEMLFIYNQSLKHNNSPEFQNQIVRNTFMEFYQAMKKNSSQSQS